MLHLHRRWHPAFAWLGILAVLLLFIGPLISQSERLWMDAPVPGNGAMHAMSGDVHTHAGMATHGQDDLAACGYCTLFAHVPGLDLVATLPAIAFIAPRQRPTLHPPPPVAPSHYPRFSPRAPPPATLPHAVT